MMDTYLYIAVFILALMLVFRPLSSNVPWILYLVGQFAYAYFRPVSDVAFWFCFWLVSVALYGVYSLVAARYATHHPPPPGPAPRPIIGNLLDLPPKGVPEFQHWLAFHKDQYGGISSVSALGTTLVIIHDKQAALDLLEKPGTNKLTSGRASMRFATELVGFENALVCMPFGDRFRRYRKMMHAELGTRAAAARFHDAQEEGMRNQLVRIYDEPARLIDHYKNGTAATIMKSTYGYTVAAPQRGSGAANDPLVRASEQMMEDFSVAAVPMKWAVDTVPPLKYLPDWCPGAGFKTTARAWRKNYMKTAYVPYRFVQHKMAQRPHRACYVSRLVEQLTADGGGRLAPADDSAIMWTAETLFGAATDTTVIVLTAFTLAMVRFPGVQAAARAEMDRVVGRGRLPTTADRARLPYTSAIVKETLRWWPLAPMGFPHRADADIDYDYRGTPMTIPRGALLMPAAWWFLHDPAVYADPAQFDPARFLPPRSEPEPTDAFGYGRRVCPGRFFADASLYLNISQLLAVFAIGPAVDAASGSPMGVQHVAPKPGVLAYPTDFPFSVAVRDAQAAELLETIKREFPAEPSDVRDLDGLWEAEDLFGDDAKG